MNIIIYSCPTITGFCVYYISVIWGSINEYSISMRLGLKTRWLSMGAWENFAFNIIVGLMMSLMIRH